MSEDARAVPGGAPLGDETGFWDDIWICDSCLRPYELEEDGLLPRHRLNRVTWCAGGGQRPGPAGTGAP